MKKSEYQSILNHCFAAYNGLNTAQEEYSKAVEEYWGEKPQPNFPRNLMS